MSKIGYTGTREGMTVDQWAKVQALLAEHFQPFVLNEFHDGDCVGGDTQAHAAACAVVRSRGWNLKMHGWPCNLEKFRAWNDYDILHKVMPPLTRNRFIVQNADLMIAGPKEYVEVFRGSGTWATIRYARRLGKHLIIVWPDGTVSEERKV